MLPHQFHSFPDQALARNDVLVGNPNDEVNHVANDWERVAAQQCAQSIGNGALGIIPATTDPQCFVGDRVRGRAKQSAPASPVPQTNLEASEGGKHDPTNTER